jgi:hypothetical protein
VVAIPESKNAIFREMNDRAQKHRRMCRVAGWATSLRASRGPHDFPGGWCSIGHAQAHNRSLNSYYSSSFAASTNAGISCDHEPIQDNASKKIIENVENLATPWPTSNPDKNFSLCGSSSAASLLPRWP